MLIVFLSITIPAVDYVLAKRVYRRCPISLLDRVTLLDLVELDMSYLGWIGFTHTMLALILELEWLSSNSQMSLLLEWKGVNSMPKC